MVRPAKAPPRKRAREEDEEEQQQDDQHHQAHSAAEIDALLERTIREIVGERTFPSTACPSEIPRRLEQRQQLERRRRRTGGDDDDDDDDGGDAAPALPPWRDLMPATREAAFRLAREGFLQVTQRGQAVEDLAEVRGPIRLRPMPATTRGGGSGGRSGRGV
jgi:hypothetical protein